MKKIIKSVFVFTTILLSTQLTHSQNNIGINTASPDASAALDITSSDKGILIPRMTSAQKAAIVSPATALMVYQTDGTKGFYYNSGTTTLPVWSAMTNSNSSGPTLQLYVVKTTGQTTAISSSSAAVIPDAIPFQSTNTGTLTNNNTYNATTSVFTVGSTGAGFYSIEVRLISTVINCTPMLDFGGGWSFSSIFGTPYSSTPTLPSPYQHRGVLNTTMYLNNGDAFTVRGISGSAVAGATLNGDASCRFTIVKLN